MSEGSLPAVSSERKKTCFVIMPYCAERKHPVSGDIIDFDATYEKMISPAVKAAGMDCIRADHVEKAGVIHKDMIERILTSDMVVVDITTGNPNVLYELGIRHTARKTGTIIIRRQGDRIPFNINAMRVIEYEFGADEAINESHRDVLSSILKANLQDVPTDSLVHTMIPDLNMTRRAVPLSHRKTYHWKWKGAQEKRFCIVTGDITNIVDVDVWVNPENTKMQMGRLHDDSVSASIRFYGARRDNRGSVLKDYVHNHLHRQIGGLDGVEAGTVIVTNSGCLRKSNGVKAIFHVAAQHGEPGKGYVTIRSYPDCVTNALEEADEINDTWERRFGLRSRLTSIIFPLLGTRGAERDPQVVADRLVVAAREHVDRYPDSHVSRICFLAYTDRDEQLCEAAFRHAGFEYVDSVPR